MDALAVSETRIPEVEGEQPPLTSAVNGHGVSEAEENKFSKAIASWRTIDLSSLVPKLDSTASEVVSHQREALVERKELAQKTKDFRKLEDSAKLTEYKSLLKAYQIFIDLLTNHGKTSSSAFLQIYSTLSDAPDPFPLLEASVDSLVLSEDTLPKLTSENEELQKRIKKLTLQLEETEHRLESESNSRRQLEDNSDTRIQEVEANWTKVLEEKQSNWEAKEKSLEEKIENQDRLLKEVKAGYEVAQRLNHSDVEATAMAQTRFNTSELEIMSADLEKTSTRLAEMEARNEQLRFELLQASSQSRQGPEASLHEDPAYIRLQTENSSLLRKLDSAQFDRDSTRREWEDKLRHLDRQRALLDSANTDLRAKVQNWSNYDEIYRELEMLRSIELSTGDDDEDPNVPTSQANGAADSGKPQSLEQLLLTRNKKLSSELTILRVSYQELQQQLEKLQEEFQRTYAELETSQKLSSTLENDLLRLQEEASNALPSSGMSVAGTYVSRYPQSSRRGRSSPTSSIISGYEVPRGSSATLESLRSGEPVGGGGGILPMIQAQRDRFKQKNSQLEEELSKTYATVTALRQEVASLQKDNLGLYEKSRYVSAYSRGPNTTTSSSVFAQGPSHTSIAIPDSSPSVSNDRYRAQYEANISPFAAFRGRESARAYKRMTLPERVIFSVTRMVLATRTSRNLFAAYCLALHLLIFFMLYWSGTTEVEKHATHLGEAAAVGLASSLKKSSKAGLSKDNIS